ncbi:MAG: hypothetical protein ACK5V3_09460 [Bdellovibrionales bacterium]
MDALLLQFNPMPSHFIIGESIPVSIKISNQMLETVKLQEQTKGSFFKFSLKNRMTGDKIDISQPRSPRELRDIGGSFWVCIGSCSSFRDGLDLASKEEGHLRPFKGLI